MGISERRGKLYGKRVGRRIKQDHEAPTKKNELSSTKGDMPINRGPWATNE